MFGNFAATIDTKDKVVQTFPEFGWEFLDCPIEYNIAGESDWKPFAQTLKDCGAEVVYYRASRTRTCRTCSTTPPRSTTRPIWIVDLNAYLQSFADWNATGNGDNVYLRTAFYPFEQADDVPPPSSTWTSSRPTAATPACSVCSRPPRSCCGPPPPTRAAPS